MKPVPVIDLLHGQVVHARKGERANYQPIKSSLCRSSQAEDIVEALLELHPFSVLYIADLDSILRSGSNFEVLARIRQRFPELDLWVDAGFSDERALSDWMNAGIGDPVVGSETLADICSLTAAVNQWGPLHPILSLDFRDSVFVGPEHLLEQPECWPQRVIAMTLARVGSDQGPDYSLLGELISRAPGRQIFAAGGVRGAGDLEHLVQLGVSGVLLASALHNGHVRRSDLARYA